MNDSIESLTSFLNEHFRTGPDYFVNSVEFIKWALMLPYADDDMQIILKRSDEIIAVGTCFEIKLYGVNSRFVSPNFLCIHKDYRNNGLTKCMILKSHVNISKCGINGVIWLSEKVLPAHVVSVFSYYAIYLKDHILVSSPVSSSGQYRIAGESDVPFITSILNKGKYLSPIFDEVYTSHYFIKYQSVVRSLVLDDEFGSYVIRQTNSGTLSAYLFYFSGSRRIVECCVDDAFRLGISIFLISDVSKARRDLVVEMNMIKTGLVCYYYSNIDLVKTDDVELVLI